VSERHEDGPPRAARLLAGLVAVVLTASLAAACGTGGPTFAPSGPCLADGRVRGAYPELESRLPVAFDGIAPTSVDSGRNCSDAALGSLISHDVHELHFGGATWDQGGGKAISIAVLALPAAPLPAAWAEEFYDIGARTARKTENIATSRPSYPGAGAVFRLDTLNDLSFQSVVVWQDGPLVRVVIVATPVDPSASRTAHDDRVARAVAAAVTSEPVLPSPT
jgi:hypothetical protein